MTRGIESIDPAYSTGQNKKSHP